MVSRRYCDRFPLTINTMPEPPRFSDTRPPLEDGPTDFNPYAYEGGVEDDVSPFPGPFDPVDGPEPHLPLALGFVYTPPWFSLSLQGAVSCPVIIEDGFFRLTLPKFLGKRFGGETEYEWSHDQARSRITWEENKPLFLDFRPRTGGVPDMPLDKKTAKRYTLKLTVGANPVTLARFRGWLEQSPEETVREKIEEARRTIVFNSSLPGCTVLQLLLLGIMCLMVVFSCISRLDNPFLLLSIAWSILAVSGLLFTVRLCKKQRPAFFLWGMAVNLLILLSPPLITLFAWLLRDRFPMEEFLDHAVMGAAPMYFYNALCAFGMLAVCFESFRNYRKYRKLNPDGVVECGVVSDGAAPVDEAAQPAPE